MRRFNSFRRQIPVYAQALGLMVTYAAWLTLFRVIFLTIVTYFLMSESTPLHEISEFALRNQAFLAGVSSLLFVGLLGALHPLNNTRWADIFPLARERQEALLGILSGSTLAVGFTFALWMGGHYQFWGFFIQSENPLVTAGSLALRIVWIVAWVYAEEFLFRDKLFSILGKTIPTVYIALFSAGAYSLIKYMQFETSQATTWTLFLISLRLGLLRARGIPFVRGAALWASLLCLLHVGFSLPIFGTEYSGIVYFRYRDAIGSHFGGLMQLLSGGSEGPLGSITLQLILIGQVALELLQGKKSLWIPKVASLR